MIVADFRNNYNGNYKITKYGGVNKHRSNYDKNSNEAKEFLSEIELILGNQSINETKANMR